MVQLMFPEARALHFHRVVLDEATRTPNLIVRAREELERLRTGQPHLAATWSRWTVLLALPLAEMAVFVLDDGLEGGLLRAHSPLYDCLVEQERMALWQRVGLQQFVGFFHEAVDDLGLDLADQQAMTGLDTATLHTWRERAPLTMLNSIMDRLKVLVSIHRSLAGFTRAAAERRAWLDEDNPAFGAAPIELMRRGEGEEVADYLLEAVQEHLPDSARPNV